MDIIIEIIVGLVVEVIEFIWGEKAAPRPLKIVCGILVFGFYIALLGFLIFAAIHSQGTKEKIVFAAVAVLVLGGIGAMVYRARRK